ncbi:NADH-ubiquinone oxidoreductase chain K [Salmonella enterica subsp. arizonae]|nr:NADH-ubiquinone oxidoreductase chain K [Salmonella enterica subsp. arizonae]
MTARKEKRRSAHDPFTTWTDPRCDFIRPGFNRLVIRRNLLFMLIGLEIMINASALAFVVAGSYWGQTDGQVMYILAISLAAAEASIGLALLLQLHRRRQNLNIDSVSEMRG